MSLAPQPPGLEPTPPIPKDFRIGDRIVHPQLNRIRCGTRTLQLEPKIMRVLLRLAERPGEVVTKERLFQDVWEGNFVTEDVLTRAIGELRRVFDDDAASPRVIETIRKTGYRLIARPEAIEASPDLAETKTAPAPSHEWPRWARTRLVLLLACAGLVAAAVVWIDRHRSAGRVRPIRVRPLTSLPGNQRDPAISPDGTRVAFVWNGGSGNDYSLYVQLVDSETPLRLTREPRVEDRGPTWSPDGQMLAFTRSESGDCQILTIAALGGPEASLGPCGDRDYRRLAWSPDGAWLAFPRRDQASQLGIELASLETRQRKTLTHPPAGILGDSSPSFSPDGKRLAFCRNLTEGVNDLYSIRLDGSALKRLTFDNRDTMGLDWSSAGDSLVFSSSRAGIYSLWRVSASGGEPTFLAGGGVKIKHPSSARGRDAVAFENWFYELNLWRVPLEGAGVPGALTQTTDQWNFEPSLNPDGSRVAFVSTRSGNEEIWVAGTDGQGARRLTSFAGARIESPRWSPDGGNVVFSARRPAQADLWTVDTKGGVPEQRTSGPGDSLAPAWSRDGRSIYFASRRSGPWEVWNLSLADGRATRVTTRGGYSARESPDGSWLFFTSADTPGIWKRPISGGPAARVVSALAPEDWANWDVGERGIYFKELCPKHTKPGVALLAFDAKEPVDVAPLPDQGWSGFAVSQDGRFLVYSRVDRQSCDIRLIENSS
jgi:Tol biopolymer transport system component/DNA-binding winged helix-turn-helix (wHTH) protein